MDFNDVENLSDDKLMEIYSDVIEGSTKIASSIPSVYNVSGGTTYSLGCDGSYYGQLSGCGYHEQFVYGPWPYCDYDYVYVIPYSDCPAK